MGRIAARLTLLLLVATASPAGARASVLLDPGALGFTGLGSANASSGTVVFDTDTGQVSGAISRPSGTGGVENGIGVYQDPSGLTAFDFASLTLSSTTNVSYVGSRPLALLATGDIAIHGSLAAGPAPSGGAGMGGDGQKAASTWGGGGGGSFATLGGPGGSSGGSPGPTYGVSDLSTASTFPTGSAGGAGVSCGGTSGVPGGSGGGGLALIALGTIDLTGATVSAAGGQPSLASGSSGGGGGSGGAIMVVAPAYTDTAATQLNLDGGAGGPGSNCVVAGFHFSMGDGGGGGGGRVTFVTGNTPNEIATRPAVQPNGPDPGGAGTVPPAPVESGFLTATGPTTGRVGVPTSGFSATVPIGQLSATTWDWGDGTTSNGPTHTYAAPGTYTVKATGTMSGSGATTSAMLAQQITVTDTLDHIVLSPSAATIHAGASQTFSAAGFDSGGAAVGDRSADTTFSISPGGSCTGNSCGAAKAGVYTVTGAVPLPSGATATSTAQLTVIAWATATRLTCAPALAQVGTKPVCTAVVSSPGGGVPTGHVTFSPAGSCVLSGGRCQANLAVVHTGTNSVTASYTGDDAHAANQGNGAITGYDNRFTIQGLKLDAAHGTATLTILAPQNGRISLGGAGVAPVSEPIHARHALKLRIVSVGTIARQLLKNGRATLHIRLDYQPIPGRASTQFRKITLIRR